MMSVRWISTLVMALALGPTVKSDPGAQAKAAFAFGAVANQKVAASAPAYAELYAQSVRESRPLCVWIGYGCPSSARQVDDMLHFQVEGNTWEGGKWQGPGVLIGVPHEGELYVGEFVKAEDCCASELRRAAKRSQDKFSSRSQRNLQQNHSQPTGSGHTSHPRGRSGRQGTPCVG